MSFCAVRIRKFVKYQNKTALVCFFSKKLERFVPAYKDAG